LTAEFCETQNLDLIREAHSAGRFCKNLNPSLSVMR
jgi:hypothetical protein